MSKNINFDKDMYRDLCGRDLEVPVFYQAWWLDIVCGSNDWQVALYIEDPHVVAVMPYYLKRISFFDTITMPALTKFMGPFFVRKFDDRKSQSILNKLVEALPPVSKFVQTLHYQIKNWLPYKWKGFGQTAYYSYVLRGIKNLDQIWKNIDSDYRNNKIARAEELFEIRENLDFDTLYRLTTEPFERQKIKMPVSRPLLEKIIIAAETRKSGKSFYAIDRQGITTAVVFLIWDRKSCYLLLAGENEDSRSNGGGIYLIWKAIEYASKNLQVNTFDFLGGMSENLERTRRQFGAEQVPYFLVSKYTGLLKLWHIINK